MSIDQRSPGDGYETEAGQWDARRAPDGRSGRRRVPQISKGPLDGQTLNGAVVAFRPHEHPHLLAISEQAANQIGAKVAGGPCNERDACTHGVNSRQ